MSNMQLIGLTLIAGAMAFLGLHAAFNSGMLVLAAAIKSMLDRLLASRLGLLKAHDASARLQDRATPCRVESSPDLSRREST